MNVSIDLENSIRKNRIVYLGNLRQRLIIFLRNYILAMPVLIISLIFFVQEVQAGYAPFIFLSSLLILFVLVSLYLSNRLAKTKGLDLRQNQSGIVRLVLRKHPGVVRHNSSAEVIIITSARESIFLNKKIIILQQDTHVYMNITQFGRDQLTYVLLGIPNYLRCRAVLKEFNRTVLSYAEAA